jgi:hypothetical protein
MGDLDDFDPFGLGSESEEVQPMRISVGDGLTGDAVEFDPFFVSQPELNEPPEVSRITRGGGSVISANRSVDTNITNSRKGPAMIPPRLVVKLMVHEEVSSVAKQGPEIQGASEASIEGSVYAQVLCSDAMKNAPFLIHVPVSSGTFSLRPHAQFSEANPEGDVVARIPKSEIGFVHIANYTLTDTVEHMPILLERKISIHETSCRIAIQIRSKLTNGANMEEFSIAVAVPDDVDGESVTVLRGDGVWDGLKRILKWKLPALDKGESFMVSAQASLYAELEKGQELNFPVLLRCTSSADQISDLDIQVIAATDQPSALTHSKTHDFRLLHRLT